MKMKMKKIGFLVLTSLSLLGACNEMEPIPSIPNGIVHYLTTPVDGSLIYEEATGDVYYVETNYILRKHEHEEQLAVAKEIGVKMDALHFIVTGDRLGASGKVLGDVNEFYYLTYTVTELDADGVEHQVEKQALTYRYYNPEHEFGTKEVPDVHPAYEFYVLRVTAQGERVDEVYAENNEISPGTSDYYCPYHETYIREGIYINVNVTLNQNMLDPIRVDKVLEP